MKTLTLFLSSLIIAHFAFSQNDSAERIKEPEVFTIVEQMPEYPGGIDSLFTFFEMNMKYPDEALSSKTGGMVYVGVVILEDGSVSDARVLRGIGKGCDEEAIRLVESSGKWIPGKQRGKAVRVKYNLPVRFKLPLNENE